MLGSELLLRFGQHFFASIPIFMAELVAGSDVEDGELKQLR
jgi:hypothetical protein